MTADRKTPARAIRPTGTEIDEQLLDITAGLLARHGIKAMSMNMVAEAAGYSKASLFRRFGDKERLVGASLQRCVDLGTEALSAVTDHADEEGRDITALRTILDLAITWPGFIALALASITVRDRDEFGGRLNQLGDALLAMFSVRGLNEHEPLLRALGALSVIAVLSLYSRDDPATAKKTILEAAKATLHSDRSA